MPFAPGYTPTTSFVNDETNTIAGRSTVRTVAVDIELANVSASITALKTNLQALQRDDNKAKDYLIEPYALAEQTRVLLAAKGTPRGNWVTATSYAIGDTIQNASIAYVCYTAHISSAPFTSPGFWIALSSNGDAVGSAIEATASKVAALASQTAAAASATAAAASATTAGTSATAAGVSATTAENSTTAAAGSAAAAATSATAAQTSGSAIALRTDLAASGGSALSGYLPAGTGAVAQTVQSQLRKTVFVSNYIPAVVNITTTDCTPYIQAAIDATPSGGTIDFDLLGTAMIDTVRAKFVTTQNGAVRHSCALLIDRPMKIKGYPACILRVKDFSAAWVAMVLGDVISAVMVTSSGVTIDGLEVDANGDNHYEIDVGGFKWWETGPTNKRPLDGISVQVALGAPNITNVLITNCGVVGSLAGVSFRGNMETETNTAFTDRTRTTGTVEGCVARNNRISRHRGNGILFVAGVTACRSERNRMKNGMYHAVRYYSGAVDCESIGDIEYTDCDAVIARWNATDNGYWRTDKSADIGYKIARAGFCFGGAFNYISNLHNILDCTFAGGRGKFKRMAVNHLVYYADNDVQLSGLGSVQPPPGSVVSNMRLEGYYIGCGLTTPTSTPVADRKEILFLNNQFLNSANQAMNFTETPKITAIGNACIGSNISASTHIRVDVCPTSFFAENSFSNGTKTGTRIGIQIFGDATGIKLGRNYHDANISAGNQVVQDSASTPKLPVGATIALSGYTNGWLASAFKTGTAGFECQITPQQNAGMAQISLRLDATGATTPDVLTLPAGLAPAALVSTILIDAVNGARHFCRILTSGLIQVQDIPGTGRPTALYGNIVYACV